MEEFFGRTGVRERTLPRPRFRRLGKSLHEEIQPDDQSGQDSDTDEIRGPFVWTAAATNPADTGNHQQRSYRPYRQRYYERVTILLHIKFLLVMFYESNENMTNILLRKWGGRS